MKLNQSIKYLSVPVLSLLLTACGGSGGNNEPESVNLAPTASFTQSCTQLNCYFDASFSSDPDGNLESYRWDFGDGESGSGVTPTHRYSAAGNYTVTLIVTDNKAATHSINLSINTQEFQGILVTGTAGRPISPTTLAHLDIAGFLVHQGWKDIETMKGVFDWTFIDGEFASALINNKVIRPALHIGGDDSPKWLYDDMTIPFVLGKDGAISTQVGTLTFSGNTVSTAGAIWPVDLMNGKIIEITGTPSNDGRYRTTNATTTSFTVAEQFVDESSVSGTINIDVVPSYWDAQFIQHKSDFYNALITHLSSLGQPTQNAILSLSIQMVGPNTGDWSFKDSPEHTVSYNAAGWLSGNDTEKQEGLDRFSAAMKLLYDNVVPNISGSTLIASAIGPVPVSLLPTGTSKNQPVNDIYAYVDANYPGKLLVAKGALNSRTYFANPCPATGTPWEKICNSHNFLQINWSASSLTEFNANGNHEWDKSNYKATATVLKNAGLSAYTYNARWFEIWHADVDSDAVLNNSVLQSELNIAIGYIKDLFQNGRSVVGAPIAIQAPPTTMNSPVGNKFVLQYIFDYNGEVPDLFEVRKDSIVVGNDLSYTIENPTANDSGLYEISCRNSAGTTTISSQITFQ